MGWDGRGEVPSATVKEIRRGRHTAEIDTDFVVFLIGARVNTPWRLVKALRSVAGMKPMLDHLMAHPEKGLLGYTMGFPVIVQYWRSFEQLEAFSRDASEPHLPAWRRWTRTVHKSAEAGIWHETYKVRSGEYEAIYDNMPTFGLAKATSVVPIGAGRETAAERLGRFPG
jgi:hypothetical protein